MIIVYRTDTGEIVDNTGTNSMGWPSHDDLEACERVAMANVPDELVDKVAWLHLDDESDEAQRTFTDEYDVDPRGGEMRWQGPRPEPPPPPPTPRDEALERIRQAKSMANLELNDLKLALGLEEASPEDDG